MAQQGGERTEKATSRQRQRARNQGKFAYSRDLTSAITLGACAATAFYHFQSPSGFRSFFAGLLENATKTSGSDLIRQAGTYFLVLAAPIFVASVVAALAGNLIQGLPVFASEASSLKWERLNPTHILARLKSQISWIQWLKLFFLVGLVCPVVWITFSGSWDQIVTLPVYSIDGSNLIIRSVMLRVVVYVIAAVGSLAIADFYIQRWEFERSIKQTKAEVKDDRKATEGDPTIKSKIRSIQRSNARRRMMSRVKDADVIVTGPAHYAVALQYQPDTMPAPRVVAKVGNWPAQKLETSQDHDIPTVENVPLASALYRSVEVEEEIPADLYQPVAEVLAGIYKNRKRI